VDGQLVANAQKCHASEFGNGRGKLIQLCSKLPLPHPHLQIRQHYKLYSTFWLPFVTF
jgi:hypothetical protein